jgi:hypothetical protein
LLGDKGMLPHLLIFNERFMTFDKNPLEIFKCEHIKKLSDFAQMGILIKTGLVDQI